MNFRDLRADEVDCRISTITEKGVSLLLYKDARCDMNILDETVGNLNWKREHCRENANCIVSIWDDSKKQWVSKEDTGTESFTEAEKGLASDSFKRACFNWGIGRELYTAPFIWVKAGDCKIVEDKRAKNGITCRDRFEVSNMKVKDKRIVSLEITNNGKRVFAWGEKPAPIPAEPFKRDESKITLDTRDKILELAEETKTNLQNLMKHYGVETLSQLNKEQGENAIEILESKKK